MSPLLFNLLSADVEEEMGKVRWGGIKVEGDRVYTLAYADNMVLLAENEDEKHDREARVIFGEERIDVNYRED